MNLYRIISLESFIDLIHNRHERFVRPFIWDDKYEGFLFSKLYNQNSRRKIIEYMYYNICNKNYGNVINNVLKLEHAKWFVYAQCWSGLKDSDAMWRIYSYNNHSIQIRTTDKRIDNMLKLNLPHEFKYEIQRVKYDVESDADIVFAQTIQLGKTHDVYEPFLHKRRAFKHECEYRILIDDVRWFIMTELSMGGATWQIDEKMKTFQNDKEIIDEIEKRLDEYMGKWEMDKLARDFYIDVPDLSKYIKGVRVNPFAEMWYVRLIKQLCEEYKLNFDGQSELYTGY